ncbi:MAG TPA: hybrid sensor histidine kinase/response regulator [Polyangiaceae bacterium]|nr:hybrid sensor histidine kinase/response regulator [Polyangiaceae bacterium]
MRELVPCHQPRLNELPSEVLGHSAEVSVHPIHVKLGVRSGAVAHILHIEDDPKNRLLVRKLLVAAGHQVSEAEGGIEGIRLARETQPDLVLVDLRLPDLDGYEVTLRLRGIRALDGVPIVAITAEGDRGTSLAVGADGFLEKPIRARSFARRISRFLRGYREKSDEPDSRQLRLAGQRIVERLERKVVELSAANAKLEEMARLRREFLRNLSHELATPMTPIVGYLKLILDEDLGPITPAQQKGLLAVQNSTERLRGLIDTLLDVSSLETGRMRLYNRAYNFGTVAARALRQAQPAIEARRIELHVEPAPAGLDARGDPDKLRRAMVHMLDNAAKFSPEGGEVAVGIARVESGHSLELRIADDGPGISKVDQARVFDAFYQVDGSVRRAHGGVGLGLAFSRRAAEALGGAVTLHSPPIHEIAGCRLSGTEVVLRVPVQPPQP